MRHHELKTWPVYFEAVHRGEKLFEARKNDRFFQAGDTVDLVEYDPDERAFVTGTGGYSSYATGANRLSFRVGPVLQGGQFGIEPGHCVFSLLSMEQAA